MRSQGMDVPLPVVGEFNPPNRLLCGPGPGNAHPRVLSKMGLPQVGHLDPYFLELMEEIKALLRYTFQTKNDSTIPVSGTGSAAMEACVCNMLEPGDTILVGVNGYFGNRLCDMASRYGAKVCLAQLPGPDAREAACMMAWGRATMPSVRRQRAFPPPAARACARKTRLACATERPSGSQWIAHEVDSVADVALRACCVSMGRVAHQVVKMNQPWGHVFTFEEIKSAVEQHKPTVLALVHAETSTGACQPFDGVGELCRKHQCLLIADCVTSISGVPLYLDKWGIDAAYAGTQKALSCPPGVAPLSFSPRAMAKLMNRKTPVANWCPAPSCRGIGKCYLSGRA